MAGNNTFEKVIERYCYVVGQNVAMTVTFSGSREIVRNCPKLYDCSLKRGKCTNRFLIPIKEENN